MKHSKTCPSCDGRSFFVVDEVNSPHYEFSNAIKPLGLACVYGPDGSKGFFGGKNKRHVCTMEAWVCKGCGLTQIYAKDLDILEKIEQAGEGVRTVNG